MNLFNIPGFWPTIGGLSSLFLYVTIKYALSIKRFNQEKASINRHIQNVPKQRQIYGQTDDDVKDWLNKNGFAKLNYIDELFKNSIQPLLILIILNLVNGPSSYSTLYLIVIVILSYYHEIIEISKFSWWYKLLIISLWVIFFIIAFNSEKQNENKKDKSNLTLNHKPMTIQDKKIIMV